MVSGRIRLREGKRWHTLCDLVLELKERLELVLGGPSLGEGDTILGVLVIEVGQQQGE